jgi:hypothetical protein
MPQTLKLPRILASGHVPAGLTAPALRLALVLLAAADSYGRVSVVKPHLERDAGVRLDNADRALQRVRDAVIPTEDGEIKLFDEITYLPGEQKRLAGIVTASVSGTFRSFAGMLGEIHGPIDELRRLTTAPGICLWLYTLPLRQAGPDHRIRLKDEDTAAVFGEYLSRATIKRSSRGETFQWTSLSRIYQELIMPGVEDLFGALEGWTIDAIPAVPEAGRGRAWSHVELTVTKLAKRPTAREAMAKYRESVAYAEARAADRKAERESIKSEEAAQRTENESVIEQGDQGDAA